MTRWIQLLRRLPGLAREALLLEIALYRSLARWVTRRPDVPRGTSPIGYAQLVGPMLWLWIVASAAEVVAVEVLLQHLDAAWAEAARLPLLVLGIWGVLWILGFLAAFRVRPHLLGDDVLRVRSGARTWVDVPLAAIAATRPAEHEVPGTVRVLHLDDGLLLVGVGSRTNLELVLDGPTSLATSRGATTADRIGLWVDEPRAVGRLLRPRVVDPST